MFFACTDLAVPHDIMHHVVRVESSGNPYAIGVVGGRLQRQPKNLAEAVATAKMLEQKGFNFSLGLAQVNRYNLKKYGLHSYEHAFQVCPNVKAGSHILRECYNRAKDWGKSFSCYYSGNFVTGYKHGYVQKIFSSMKQGRKALPQNAIPVINNTVASRPILQMTAQQPNSQNSTVATDLQSYPVTVSKKQHNLRDNNAVQAQSNIYTDSAAVF
jgi:virB1 protein|nr:lytic transglycosylase domain-containing protein [uncultured Neisseria sp.]